MTPSYLTTPEGRKLAYHHLTAKELGADLPGIVFLGGFKSDMQGTKAQYLQDWAQKRGREFLRFDYSGHGQSSGAFTDGCIGDWAQDAMDVIGEITTGPQILVGSSMGGWISLLVARSMPERVRAFVGIAAAPDFTEDGMWPGLDDEQKAELEKNGQVSLHSDYSDDPYIITKRLIEDGRKQLVLRSPLDLPFPVRLLHGTADVDVNMSVPLALMRHATCGDMQLTLIKHAGHQMSQPEQLQMISEAILAVG